MFFFTFMVLSDTHECKSIVYKVNMFIKNKEQACILTFFFFRIISDFFRGHNFQKKNRST